MAKITGKSVLQLFLLTIVAIACYANFQASSLLLKAAVNLSILAVMVTPARMFRKLS